MKAIILAAGEGKRLRPFTETMPKVMLPIENKPIIEYVIDAVKNSGIEEIILVVGYKKEVIMEYFRNYKDIKISFVEQKNQLGTAHALLQAKELIHDNFLVLAGDNIIDKKSISKILDDNSEYGVLIKKHALPSKYGLVCLENDFVKEIIEKPRLDEESFISTGIYKLNKSIFDQLEQLTSEGNYALSSVIQLLIDQEIKIHTIIADLWMDVVYPWDLLSVNEAMFNELSASVGGIIEKGVVIKGQVSIGKGTHVYSGCYILGPVVIGENCEIGPNTCIFPSTTIGNNSVIHSFSEIRNSMIMNDIHIGSSSFIENSIIGTGTIIKNNFSSISEKSSIILEDDFKIIDNIGSMIGDDCIIESHVVVDSGIIIGRKCQIKPMKHITKNISSGSKVM